MADVSMKDFLLQYYMQLRFNNMPAEVMAKYKDFLKGNDGKGDFRGNMGDWKKKLMHENPPASGNWENNALPDPTDTAGAYHLTDSEWEKLFKAFQDAFRAMNADSDSFKENKKATDFMNEYFGDASKLFAYATANNEAETQIINLLAAFNNHPQLEQALKQSNIVSSDFSLSDFKSKLSSKKYNSDPKVKDQLEQICNGLEWLAQNNPNVSMMVQGIDFYKITSGFDSAIDPNKIQYFKRMYRPLLNSLGQESKIFDTFKNYDGGKITGQIDTAKQKVAYDDKNSDDYVPPKRTDELTPWQQLNDFAKDTYNDVLGKYLSLHGNRVYFSPSARFIVQAIDGAKIKPTDGITKVLENASKIKDNLQYKSPTATKHFDWFTKTMSEMKDTMPKAFAGALNNGRQMKALVAELVLKAVREGKIDEAKTAMEVLSVIKYGYTTSKIMDALGKEKFSVFSDPGLSWNKNEGVAFVASAWDSSIYTALKGIGYVITIAGNVVKLNGSKFNGRRGRIKSAQDAWAQQNAADRNNVQATRDNMDSERTLHQQTLDNLDTMYGINENTIAQKRMDLANSRQDEQQKEHKVKRNQQRLAAAQNRMRNLPIELRQMAHDAQNMTNEIQDIQNRIAAAQQFLRNPNTGNLPPQSAAAMAQAAAQELADLNRQLAAKQAELQELQNKYQVKSRKLQQTPQKIPTYQADLQAAENDLRAISSQNNRADTRLSNWDQAKDTISMLNAQIQQHDTQLQEWDDNHKDRYMELMAYWDLLETGRDTHTGPMYKWGLLRSNKHSQSKFDKQKNTLISNYMSGYSYAA